MNPAQQALYTTFSASCRELGETDTLFLRQMCWIPQEFKDASGYVDTELAAVASGKSPSQARDALERLAALFLLDRPGDDKFRLHDRGTVLTAGPSREGISHDRCTW